MILDLRVDKIFRGMVNKKRKRNEVPHLSETLHGNKLVLFA